MDVLRLDYWTYMEGDHLEIDLMTGLLLMMTDMGLQGTEEGLHRHLMMTEGEDIDEMLEMVPLLMVHHHLIDHLLKMIDLIDLQDLDLDLIMMVHLGLTPMGHQDLIMMAHQDLIEMARRLHPLMMIDHQLTDIISIEMVHHHLDHHGQILHHLDLCITEGHLHKGLVVDCYLHHHPQFNNHLNHHNFQDLLKSIIKICHILDKMVQGLDHLSPKSLHHKWDLHHTSKDLCNFKVHKHSQHLLNQ